MELKPCPFCGQSQTLSVVSVGSYLPDLMPARPMKVVCRAPDCEDVSGPVGYGQDGAAAAWNTRAEAAEIANLREDLAEAVGALGTIADGMLFPNQMESGFAHGKPTFADMQARVELARFTANQTLAKIKGEA